VLEITYRFGRSRRQSTVARLLNTVQQSEQHGNERKESVNIACYVNRVCNVHARAEGFFFLFVVVDIFDEIGRDRDVVPVDHYRYSNALRAPVGRSFVGARHRTLASLRARRSATDDSTIRRVVFAGDYSHVTRSTSSFGSSRPESCALLCGDAAVASYEVRLGYEA